MENQVQLIGRLGMNPNSKQVNQSVKTTFTLATNTVYRDSEGNKKTMTDWHNIIAWGNLAQTMDQYLKKGDKVVFPVAWLQGLTKTITVLRNILRNNCQGYVDAGRYKKRLVGKGPYS